jgi:hypothetical protein
MNSQRLLWSSVVAVGIAATLVAQAPKPAFEVATVRPQIDRTPVPPTRTSPDTFYRRGETVESPAGAATQSNAY